MKVEIQEKHGTKTIDCEAVMCEGTKVRCINISLNIGFPPPILSNVDVELVCGTVNIIFPFRRLVSIIEGV